MQIFRLGDVLLKIPKLLLKGTFDFEFELLPYRSSGIGAKKAANFFLAGLNQYFLPARPFGYPVIAQVEPANICNLKCPLCLTTSLNKSRPPALLSYSTFARFIEECGDYLLHLIFWNWGEPFLNPDLFRMIALARSRGIIVHTSTNGNVALDELSAEALVDSGLSSLVFAVDGATQRTYEKYRQGGRLEIVLANIEKVIRIRTRKKASFPVINMRFVAMKHNEADLPMVRALAAKLGVDYFSIKTVDMPSDCGEGLDQGYVPGEKNYRRYEYEQSTFLRKTMPFQCMRPWKRITMDAAGYVIPCEYDYLNRHAFGNIQDKGALAAWKSARGAAFRKAFHLGHNNFYLCRDCTYKNSVVDDCVVEKQVIGKNRA